MNAGREQGKKEGKNGSAHAAVRFFQSPGGRLLLIPLIVYSIWVLEIFLFQGQFQIFLHPDSAGLLFYTVVTCIFAGLVVPVVLIRQAFLSGDLNMHQLGLRPLRRTVLVSALSLIIVWSAVALQNPFGTDRTAFISAFLLLLPTGIASAMICCAFAGTHVQAFVRSRGAGVSISVGTIVTSILFALTLPAHVPYAAGPDTCARFLSAGILTALFFFSVRDIWATSIIVTGGLVYLMAGWFDPALLAPDLFVIALAAGLMSGTLAAIQWYLSRRYVTIAMPDV